MKQYLKKWKEFLFEDKKHGGKLPLDVVDFLIEKYARNPFGKVSLRRGYFDFHDFGKGNEFDDTAASYMAPSQMILINITDKDVIQGNVKVMVNAVVHEIRHYNQHMMWENDDSFRDKLSKGYKLPPGKDIFELDWVTVTEWWHDIYPYEQRPHEKDAIRFANKHFEEAYKMVIDREKELKNAKNKDKVKDNNGEV